MVDHHGGFSFDPEPVFVTVQPKATQPRKGSQLTTLTTVRSDSLQIWEAVKLYWKESGQLDIGSGWIGVGLESVEIQLVLIS